MWIKRIKELSKDYKRPELKVRDFVVLIASYGRPEELQKNTLKTFKYFLDEVDYRIIVSDDDKTLPKYLEMYGEKVFVFNKDEVLKKINPDTVDAYDNIRSVIFFEVNYEFEIAKQLGYRYFMHLEDDYDELAYRLVGKQDNLVWSNEDSSNFHQICEMYFKVLDSSPFLNSVCLSQGGDYVGGAGCSLMKYGFLNKGMNVYFLDTQKEFRKPGRINEDVNTYTTNGKLGKMFLTLPMLHIHQLQTQVTDGGMSELYKSNGTFLKSIYTCIVRPDATKISVLNSKHKRIHHNCLKRYCFVRTISEKCAKATIPYSEVEKPDLDPDFYNQKSYMDLYEPDLNDIYLETCLEDW